MARNGWTFDGALVATAAGLLALAWAGLVIAARFAAARGRRRLLAVTLAIAVAALAMVTVAICRA
jgi:hypothetical protein